MTISAKHLPTQPAAVAVRSHVTLWTWAALAVALAASGGSVWLGMTVKAKACPLCLYERAFALGVAAVFLMGLLTRAYRTTALGLLAAPLAFAGAWVALFAVLLEWSGKLESSEGFLGVGSAAQQGLAVMLLLAALVATEATRGWTAWKALFPLIVAAVLGIVVGQSCLVSVAPPAPPPVKT